MFYRLEDSLHALPAQSQVKAINLLNLPEMIEQKGGNYRGILEQFDIDPQIAGDATKFLDCRPFVEMMEYCATDLNDPLFGYHLAQTQEADVYGSVAAYCRASPDFRTAILGLIDYLPVVHSSETCLALAEGSSVSELVWSERSDMGENVQASHQGLLLNLKALRMLAGSSFVPAYINLPRESFQNSAYPLSESLGCTVRLSHGKACIGFASDLLDKRLKSANEPLFQLLSSYLSSLKGRLMPSLQAQVDDYVNLALGHGDVSIEGCSARLGVSTRTLQLRLQEHGISFSAVLERHRLERARAALKDCRLSIAEVADSLGYAERTSFGRAFKRWTGQSPQQFRNHLHGATAATV